MTKNDPGPLAHHSSVIYKNSIYVFGGTNIRYERADRAHLYKFDLKARVWERLENNSKNQHYGQSRDGHTACCNSKCMYVFGGFKNGGRTNEVLIYHFEYNQWSSNHEIVQKQGVNISTYLQPEARSDHSAVVYNNEMYVFGGRNTKKLSDLWKLNLETLEWQEIKYKERKAPDDFSDEYPMERSGHSCDMIGHFMVVFGGLYELTKELNDLFVFDLKTHKWTKIFDENDAPYSPMRLPDSSRRDTTIREMGGGKESDA